MSMCEGPIVLLYRSSIAYINYNQQPSCQVEEKAWPRRQLAYRYELLGRKPINVVRILLRDWLQGLLRFAKPVEIESPSTIAWSGIVCNVSSGVLVMRYIRTITTKNKSIQ